MGLWPVMREPRSAASKRCFASSGLNCSSFLERVMPRTPSPQDPDVYSDIYIDESSQNALHYLLIGGIIVSRRHSPAFEAAVIEARGTDLPVESGGEKREAKWQKASKAKLAAYKRVVDTFFVFANSMPLTNAHLNFHCTVVDLTRRKGRLGHVGFDKELYQLGLKYGREYRGRLFDVRLDERTTPQSVEELKNIFNFGLRKNYGREDWPFRKMRFVKSHDEPIVQVTDILLGALAYRLNGHHLAPDAAPHKIELSDYVLKKARIADPFRDTRHSGRFTVWHRDKPTVQNASCRLHALA
jgi:hypothetical protein